MDTIVSDLAKVIRTAIVGMEPRSNGGRPLRDRLYAALKKTRQTIERRFGAPVLCRYSGCPDRPRKSYSKNNETFKVLEYLWDFSLSRYAIPQAIEDPRALPMENGKFELLLVAESELGTKNEICRDLLKLLEARTCIRCLIYKQPKRAGERHKLESRMVRVLHNHARFSQSPGMWVFAGLSWGDEAISCDMYTLNKRLDGFDRISIL